MSSVAPRSGSVKGSLAAYRPEPAPAVPFPTWHALCAEMLARHREMGLSYGECCLFAVLVHYSTPDDNGVRFSHATNSTLAEKMGCEERDVRRFLKALEGGGFIERWKRTDRANSRELERSRESIMIAWRPGDDQMSPLSYPWADHSPEAIAEAHALVRQRVDNVLGRQDAPTVNFDLGERNARSNSTIPTVNSDRGCKVNPALGQGQICPTYEIPPETPKEESPLKAPSSTPTPPSPGAKSSSPPAGSQDAGALENIPAGWNVMLPPKAAGELLRGFTAKVDRDRATTEKVTPEQNTAGIEWMKRYREWRAGGKVGPIPPWISSEAMLPGVRMKFDEHARSEGATG